MLLFLIGYCRYFHVFFAAEMLLQHNFGRYGEIAHLTIVLTGWSPIYWIVELIARWFMRIFAITIDHQALWQCVGDGCIRWSVQLSQLFCMLCTIQMQFHVNFRRYTDIAYSTVSSVYFFDVCFFNGDGVFRNCRFFDCRTSCRDRFVLRFIIGGNFLEFENCMSMLAHSYESN